MKKLTNKEKEIMDLYWKHGPMFVKELLEHYDEPRPHFNTLSTLVRILEKSRLSHPLSRRRKSAWRNSVCSSMR